MAEGIEKQTRENGGNARKWQSSQCKLIGSNQSRKNVPAVNQATARSPVELKLTRAVGHGVAIQTQSLGSSLGSGKLDEAVSGITTGETISSHLICRLATEDIPRVLIADDLDIDSLTSGRKEDALDKVFIHPRLELAHPVSNFVSQGSH
jgi:hypothetical protein